MNRIKILMKHPDFKKYMRTIEAAETERIFCHHGYSHGLDVARICYIMNLEEDCGYKKDVIYAMAMLHDIGRAEEYENGLSHHIAGARIAEKILAEAGFEDSEIKAICEAISNHKSLDKDNENCLSGLLFKADKLSRNCFACQARSECYWNDDLKNKYVLH